MQRLVPESTAVVVVDIQERLVAAMPSERVEQVVRAARILVEAARILGAPVRIVLSSPAEMAMDGDKPFQIEMLRAEFA